MIYGVDTVNRKIWRTNAKQFECISDFKVQQLLSETIPEALATERPSCLGQVRDVNVFYDSFRGDVHFTLVFDRAITGLDPRNPRDVKAWKAANPSVTADLTHTLHLIYNERAQIWVTRATWYPLHPVSANNRMYSFDMSAFPLWTPDKKLYLYRHGYSGEDSDLQPSFDDRHNLQLPVMPNTWYDSDKTRFEFEFVVSRPLGVQKIFHNLKIISNRVRPEEIVIEIGGDGYDFAGQKYPNYFSVNKDSANPDDPQNVANYPERTDGLADSRYPQSPTGAGNYIDFSRPSSDTLSFLSDTELLYDVRTKEQKLRIFQQVRDMEDEQYGRRLGNAYYKEDLWDLQLDPIDYIENGREKEALIRDKFAKIRVVYTGDSLAVVTAIRTMFTGSYG
jgi:hypothetical protein